ncbi:MAG: hypothetical protein PUJ24_11510, partial [Bacteroidales bacterium]|nr:hypothetical protein [Bacteroidales bacterium]
QMGVADRFITFDAFVEPGVFSSYVRQSDYLLPLIDSSIGLCEKYKKSSISGTFTIAESYGKTMLCDSAGSPTSRISTTHAVSTQTSMSWPWLVTCRPPWSRVPTLRRVGRTTIHFLPLSLLRASSRVDFAPLRAHPADGPLLPRRQLFSSPRGGCPQ